MKKIPFTALILSLAFITAGCGREPNESIESASVDITESASTTVDAEENTTEPTAASGETTTDAENMLDYLNDFSNAGEKQSETEPTAAPTESPDEEDKYFVGLEGYWYIDGDPSAASLHISPGRGFEAFYGDGNLETRGYIKRELDTETNNYNYVMYTKSGDPYMMFADDGETDKKDIYIGNGGFPHYVKLYGEGGIGDDGRGPEEIFPGEWHCGRASLTIEDKGEGVFHGNIQWADSAYAYVEWDYPLVFNNGKLICDGTGTKTYVEYKSNSTAEPTKTVEYSNGSAEFELKANKVYWNDLNEYRGNDMLFAK